MVCTLLHFLRYYIESIYQGVRCTIWMMIHVCLYTQYHFIDRLISCCSLQYQQCSQQIAYLLRLFLQRQYIGHQRYSSILSCFGQVWLGLAIYILVFPSHGLCFSSKCFMVLPLSFFLVDSIVGPAW